MKFESLQLHSIDIDINITNIPFKFKLKEIEGNFL